MRLVTYNFMLLAFLFVLQLKKFCSHMYQYMYEICQKYAGEFGTYNAMVVLGTKCSAYEWAYLYIEGWLVNDGFVFQEQTTCLRHT